MSSYSDEGSSVSLEITEKEVREQKQERSAIQVFCCLVTIVVIILTLFLLGTAIGWEKIGIYLARWTHKNGDQTQLRLRRDVIPMMYDLTIKIYLPTYAGVPHHKELTFEGTVHIVVEMLSPVNHVVLHMNEITLIEDKCKVLWNGRIIPIIDIVVDKKMEVVTFYLKKTIGRGEHLKLELSYIGTIGSYRLSGLYRTIYTDKNGNQKMAAVTQFEPTDARLMVPCFDEPAFKAQWTVTVIHPAGTVALSNGKERSSVSEPGSAWVRTTFETTPKMSTYLLAIAVGEFDYIQGYTREAVRFRVWSRPEAINMTQFACKVGVQCLDFYDDYFEIKFPLQKQDMLALPDFAAGAMENWGLVTYRERALLYNDELYSLSDRYSVLVTIAHELAHQWFGNLVTLEWWNDLWLNEGFATYMETVSVDVVTKGEMQLNDYFVVVVLEEALIADAVATSHPLSFKIERPVEIAEAFNPISYSKGASILAMVSALMGDVSFQDGIKHYLTKFSYKNARSNDLWEALDAIGSPAVGPNGEPHLNIKNFADQWTVQMGFPLVTVHTFNSSCFKVTQSRYKRDHAALEVMKYRHPKYGFKWDVPIWYQLHDEIKFAWLRRDRPLYITADTMRDPIVVNAGRHGFFRQNYDEHGWRQIARQLMEDHKIYATRTRNAIISDAFAAADIDHVPYATVLDLLKYLRHEKEYIPWDAALSGLAYIGEYCKSEQDLATYKGYMRELLRSAYKDSFFDDMTKRHKDNKYFHEGNLQMKIIGAYCAAGAQACTTQYEKLFEEQVLAKCRRGAQASSCVKIAAPHRAGAYCYGVKKHGKSAYERVMELYKLETVHVEKDRLLRALGCHDDVTVLKSILDSTMDRRMFRTQDVAKAYQIVASNRHAGELVFNHLLEHWDEIYASLHHDHSILQKVISECLSAGYTHEHFEKVKSFVASHKEADELNVFHESSELINVRITWIEKHLKNILYYFRRNH